MQVFHTVFYEIIAKRCQVFSVLGSRSLVLGPGFRVKKTTNAGHLFSVPDINMLDVI